MGVGNLYLELRGRVGSILFLVGKGFESPSIVDSLLLPPFLRSSNDSDDVRGLKINDNVKKPQYEMASDIPLLLYDCGYEDVRFQGFGYQAKNLGKACLHYESQYSKLLIQVRVKISGCNVVF